MASDELTNDALTDDALTADYRVWQRKRGHRYSLDDVITAWEAASACPDAKRCIDLGCGIGSVLLMTAWKLPEAHFAAIEAQDISHALAARNIQRNIPHTENTNSNSNSNSNRVHLVHGDFRDPQHHTTCLQALGGNADLVTGTPPYMPVGTATPSPDTQRHYARIEMRGGVEAYLETAKQLITPEGRIVVCCDARTPERALSAAQKCGLRPIQKRNIIPRAHHKKALFSVWIFGHANAKHTTPTYRVCEFVARDSDGDRTQAYRDMRAFFGLAS